MTGQANLLTLAALVSASVCIGMSFGIGIPLTSLTLESWQEPDWVIGVAGALPWVANVVSLPLVLPRAAKIGPVPAMFYGCAAAALGYLALYALQSTHAWLLIRFLMGAALTLPWILSESWINALPGEDTRGRVIALYAIGFFLGFLAGPVVLTWTGITGFKPFATAAAACLLACVPIFFVRKEAPPVAPVALREVRGAFVSAPAGMAGGLLAGLAESNFTSLLPNVALAAGLSQTVALELLSVLLIGGIALQFPIGWFSDKIPRLTALYALGAAIIILTAILPVALKSNLAAFVTSFALGGGTLGFYTVGLAIVGDAVPKHLLVAANAAFLVAYQIGSVTGPVVAGAAMTVDPIVGFTVATIAAMIAGLAALAKVSAR